MNKQLQEKIELAERSEGYLIMITRLHSKDQLEHSYFTRSFRRDDIMPSLDEQSRLLEKEINPTKVEVTDEATAQKDVSRKIVEEKPIEKPVASL